MEYGYIDGDKKFPRDLKEGQEGYDFYMVPRYLKDIISYRTGKLKDIHHKADIKDNLKKYVALYVCKNKFRSLTFYEIGSSLMGVIDSLEYINKKFGLLNIKDISFVGIDNSRMMNAVASYLYKDYKLKLYEEKRIIPCDLFFSKGVSLLYAFDDEQLFCDILKKCKIAVFDYTFSLGKDKIKRTIPSGKPGVHLNLKKFKKLLNLPDKKLFLKQSNRKHNIPKDCGLFECIYGEEKLVKKYLKELNKKQGYLK